MNKGFEKEFEEASAKYYEENQERENSIWEYLEEHEGETAELLSFTDDVPMRDFYMFARAIAQALYSRKALYYAALRKSVTKGGIELLKAEANSNVLYITLDDLCLKCYGSKGEIERVRMSTFMERLDKTFVVLRNPDGSVSKSSFCKFPEETTREKDGAKLYQLLVDPSLIILCCLSGGSLWKNDGSDASNECAKQ